MDRPIYDRDNPPTAWDDLEATSPDLLAYAPMDDLPELARLEREQPRAFAALMAVEVER